MAALTMSQMMEDLQSGCGGDAVVQAVITSNSGLDAAKGAALACCVKGLVDVRAWEPDAAMPATAEVVLAEPAPSPQAISSFECNQQQQQQQQHDHLVSAHATQTSDPSAQPSTAGQHATDVQAPYHHVSPSAPTQQVADARTEGPEQLRLMDLLLLDAPDLTPPLSIAGTPDHVLTPDALDLSQSQGQQHMHSPAAAPSVHMSEASAHLQPDPEPLDDCSPEPSNATGAAAATGSHGGPAFSSMQWHHGAMAGLGVMELDTPFAYCLDLPFAASPEATLDSHAIVAAAAAAAAAGQALGPSADSASAAAAAAAAAEAAHMKRLRQLRAAANGSRAHVPQPVRSRTPSPLRPGTASAGAGCGSPPASARTPTGSYQVGGVRQGSAQRASAMASPPAMQSSSKKPEARCEPVSPTRCHSPTPSQPHYQLPNGRRKPRPFPAIGQYGAAQQPYPMSMDGLPSSAPAPMSQMGYPLPHQPRHPHSLSQPHPLHQHLHSGLGPHGLMPPGTYSMTPAHLAPPPPGMYPAPQRLPSRFGRPHPGAGPSEATASDEGSGQDWSRRSSASTADGLSVGEGGAAAAGGGPRRLSNGLGGGATRGPLGPATSSASGGTFSHRAASSGPTGPACQQHPVEGDVQSSHSQHMMSHPHAGHKYPPPQGYRGAPPQGYYPYPYAPGHPQSRHPRQMHARCNSSLPELEGSLPPRRGAYPDRTQTDVRSSAPEVPISRPGTSAGSAPSLQPAPRPAQPQKRPLAERDLLAPCHSAPPEALSQGQYMVDPDKPDEGWMAANLCYKRFAKDGAAVSLSEPMMQDLTEELRQLHTWCMNRHIARAQRTPRETASQGLASAPERSAASAPACSGPSSVLQPDWHHLRGSHMGAMPSPGKKRECGSSLSPSEVMGSPMKRPRPHNCKGGVSSSMAAPMPGLSSGGSGAGAFPGGQGQGLASDSAPELGPLPLAQQQSVPASWAPHAQPAALQPFNMHLQQEGGWQGKAGEGPSSRGSSPSRASSGPHTQPSQRPAMMPAANWMPAPAPIPSGHHHHHYPPHPAAQPWHPGMAAMPDQRSAAIAGVPASWPPARAQAPPPMPAPHHRPYPHDDGRPHMLPAPAAQQWPHPGPGYAPAPAPACSAGLGQQLRNHSAPAQMASVAPQGALPVWDAPAPAAAGAPGPRRSTVDTVDAMDSFLNALLDTQEDMSAPPVTPLAGVEDDEMAGLPVL